MEEVAINYINLKLCNNLIFIEGSSNRYSLVYIYIDNCLSLYCHISSINNNNEQCSNILYLMPIICMVSIDNMSSTTTY